MKKSYLYLNSRDELLRLDISKIVYFEAEGNYTNIFLANNLKCVVCMNLTLMKQTLNDYLHDDAAIFARVGKRHIINLKHVCLINVLSQRLVLSDGASFSYDLNVSKEALKSLKLLYVAKGKIQK